MPLYCMHDSYSYSIFTNFLKRTKQGIKFIHYICIQMKPFDVNVLHNSNIKGKGERKR
jgi:hypothetical protein